MDFTKLKKDAEEGGKDDLFFIGDLSNSEGEQEIDFSRQKHRISCEQAARLSGETSPPLVLAFNITGGALRNSSPSPASSLDFEVEEKEEVEEDDSDQPVEEWMILGGEGQVEDSSIQLNLSCWNSSEDDSGGEDDGVELVKDAWTVSEKDKYNADQSVPSRYFMPGRSPICNVCNRMGHVARSCYYHKKCPTCILCGIQGHIHRDCPSRPCQSCGLPSHGLGLCERPPLWNQHCQRCGMTGHLPDACPDTWRQYHLTVRFELPVKPHTDHVPKHKRCPAHCYNCSERGHYGYECFKRRMISGTSPSLPYVCHYDTTEDILQRRTRMQERVKELVSAGSLSKQQLSEPMRESGVESQLVKERSRTKQEAWGQADRRKTWPERRRERREVKRLRREAQARREGGLLGKSRGIFDDEDFTAEPFSSPLCGHRQSTASPQKKMRGEEGGKKSRKTREAERWKKRRGVKRGDLYPHGDIDICSENLLSPKQRVRHRRR